MAEWLVTHRVQFGDFLLNRLWLVCRRFFECRLAIGLGVLLWSFR